MVSKKDGFQCFNFNQNSESDTSQKVEKWKKLKCTQQDWMTDNTFSSRTPNRVAKGRFNTGLQSEDLGPCPSFATDSF